MARLLDNVCAIPWSSTITTIVVLSICFFIWNRKSIVRFLKEINCVNILLTVTGIPAFFVVIYLLLNQVCIVPNAKAMFKESFSHEPVSCFIDRPNITHKIQRLLRPPLHIHSGGYFLLEGQHGCGKTTVLKHALANCGPGVLYVSVGIDGDVGTSLHEALKIDAYCKSVWATLHSYANLPLQICTNDPLDRLVSALEILEKIAAEMLMEDHYPPAIVFDNLSFVSLSDPEQKRAVQLLQDAAKEISDKRLLIVLFASSESGVTNLMKLRSSASRLIRTINVGDITDKQAFHYLTCMCPNASKDEITTAVRLVGGRFSDLVAVADTINERDVEMTLEQQLFKSRANWLPTTLMPTLPRQVRGVLYKILHSLVNSPTGKITIDAYESLVEVLDESDLKLIEVTNILLITPKEVTFHSRLIKRYFESILRNSTVQE